MKPAVVPQNANPHRRMVPSQKVETLGHPTPRPVDESSVGRVHRELDVIDAGIGVRRPFITRGRSRLMVQA